MSQFIDQLFDSQVNRTPDLIAVRFHNNALTYSGLFLGSDRLSKVILSHDDEMAIVGISASPGIEMIVGLLAILKAGKAYLPLDPAYPKERLQQIIADSKIKTCVSPENEKDFFVSMGVDVVLSDADPEVSESPLINRSSVACVLYTSGSTGRPKGVCLGHKGLTDLIGWQHKHSIVSPGTNTLQFCHLSFDASFQEIFVPLTTGGTLVLVDEDLRLDSIRLLSFIEEQTINRIFLPFVALQYLAETAEIVNRFPACLKEVITGGEILKITPQISHFFSSLKDCCLVNVYGPTETSIWVTQLKLEGNAANWPALPSIGKPVDHAEILILDESMSLLPKGEAGELCIAGDCVAEGYLNRPELTAEKFVEWKHPKKGSVRVYRTGDLARFLKDGDIEFLGRKDNQVKIRGNRVEPGEIEVTLSQLPGVQQAVVIAREDIPGQKKLVAYVIMAGKDKNTAALRHGIEKQLPDYMMPSAFILLDEFPKTVSGKIDKNALPKPGFSRPEMSVLYKKPVTQAEKRIAELWESLLQLDRIGMDDNFFELGGNSLLAQKTVATLRQQYDYLLPVTKLYQYPNISGIVSYFDRQNTKEDIHIRKKNRPSNRGQDIAVIGMAIRFPGANTVDELWDLLIDGKETTRFFTDGELDPNIPGNVRTDPDYVKARGIIDNTDQFDAAFFGINPRLAELMDPQQRVFLEIAWEALETTGYLPQKYDGSIGVFAGCGNNTYYMNNVITQKELIGNIGSFQVMTVNEKDYVAMRTAYELDLKGPAVSVFSACSTSLLAISQAVESLRNGQCDIALAGAVTITVPVKSGYVYQEGAMFSKDGHTRPFDAGAHGTVFSDGAGVVLLKNREDAERDGDTIYALIKGMGLNNDGSGKGSFTAPNAEGQAGAIAMAIEDAGIEASSISYIEAHGTATPLGDPIEIEGLNIAFGEQAEKQFCAIGSIKSNMGHLTHAAGAAGFIKTVLALHNRQIPASLFYESSNPNIDFKNTPFFVNSTNRDWKTDKKRRAGVSSFGVGGTNVHVILEEYPDRPKKSIPANKPQVINWSAKTEESLDKYAEKLAGYLKKNPDTDLADVAYTLQSTRQDFNIRRFVIASDIEDLISKLTSGAKNAAETKTLKESATEVAFVFPGQGSQYVNMGSGLCNQEPVFKQAVDECAELLIPYLKEDIRTIIYPGNNDADAEEKLKNTLFTQPALFVVEYATAKLWMSWGVQPAALTGHSIGEFVAAHIAGVFNLEDALKIVAARAQMISELPGGSMLAVRSEAEKIEVNLPAGLSLAAVNSPSMCVISGNDKDIAAFAKLMTEKGVPNKVIQTSHAFHSSMMDGIQEAFAAVMQSIKLNPPGLPIVSTVTGKWMKDEEATNPKYWVEQLRRTVRFSDAINTLWEDENRLLLEAGPGNVATILARQQAGKKAGMAVSSFERRDDSTLEYADVLRAAGQLWQNGMVPDWKDLHAAENRQRLNLPNYAFDRKRCWVDPLISSYAVNTPALQIDNSINPEIVENNLQIDTLMRRELLLERIKKILEDASGIEMEDAEPDMNFMEIGLDSLLLTQVAITLKNEFGLPITFRQLNENLNSLDLLTDFYDSSLPADALQTTQPVNARTGNLSNLPPIQATNNPAMDAILQQLQALTNQLSSLQDGGNGQLNKPAPLGSTIKQASPQNLTPEEEVEIKKPFGATPRIEKHSSELNETQKKFLEELIQRYTRKTKGSKEYTQKHRSIMADPRVVSGFKPLTKEITYPVVAKKSQGCRIWDLDDNEYIDALNGFGSNMLGYQPDILKKAIRDQIEKGYEIGPQHELAGEVCKLVCEFTKFDRAAICSTGSEAVLGTMRTARTVTGRSLIVAFTGSYHGIFDEVIIRGTKKLRSLPAAPGIMTSAVQNMLILDYGTDESLKIIKERAHELAAVLVEAVQSRRPEFQPVEFLKAVRKITEESGTALIFDEIITGFRMHPGGVQAMFDIKADIASYGKVVGGGLPIGIIAGKKQYMDALDGGNWEFGDASTPEAGVTYFAGTFVRHPLALAAAKASLEYFKSRGPALQEELNSKCQQLSDTINGICEKLHLPIYVVNFGSLWKLKYKEDIPYIELLFVLMREKGIHILDGFPCFITEAHKDQDIEAICKAFNESANELITSEFLHPYENKSAIFVKSDIGDEPPVIGARLGRDKDGNPAWFIEDPKQPGKYMQIGAQKLNNGRI